VGKDWFGYLLSKPLPFSSRIRENYQLNDGRQSLKVGAVFADLQPGQTKTSSTMLMGILAVHCCLAISDDGLLVVATQTAPTLAITDYAKDGNWFSHF